MKNLPTHESQIHRNCDEKSVPIGTKNLPTHEYKIRPQLWIKTFRPTNLKLTPIGVKNLPTHESQIRPMAKADLNEDPAQFMQAKVALDNIKSSAFADKNLPTSEWQIRPLAKETFDNLKKVGLSSQFLPTNEFQIRPMATVKLNEDPELQVTIWTAAIRDNCKHSKIISIAKRDAIRDNCKYLKFLKVDKTSPLTSNPRGNTITVIKDDKGEPWFVAKEVCDVLGYTNGPDAVAKHCKHSKIISIAKRDGIRGNPNKTIIPESDIYRLVLRSKLPEAEKFESWVTEVVRPAIRKTGGQGSL